MTRPARSLFKPLVLASAIALSACGGDSDAPATATATGTLTDSAIAGVQYTTSSGRSGVTDADGHFNYTPGDTVTFRIGSLVLGTITATGSDETVTPIQIAQNSDLDEIGQANLVTNLLVLLQSLDSDGNADNGITITDAAKTALTSTVADSIDLTLPSLQFGDTTALSDLATAAGGTVVDPEAALAHFKAQFLADLEGVHVVTTATGTIAFRFDGAGNYLMAETGATEYAPSDAVIGKAGIERGTIDWNPQTGAVTLTEAPSLDTNAEWGLSDPGEGEKVFLSLDGDDLVVRSSDNDDATPDETLRFTRPAMPAASLAGAWSLGSTSLSAQQFIFLDGGKYLMIDPVGDDEYNDTDDLKCGDAGLEYGSYAVSGGVLTFSNATYDTNGCAGVHVQDPDAPNHDTYLSEPVTFNENGTFSIGQNDGTFYRYNSQVDK
ncbi:MAG: hypothetical protein K0Q68_26 [Moraxellaceae bacterium]|jgi:hypothetical protein|nr:hypothetical protein [Moraxellaceae bacterium]